jgi:uncharacterized membrane protein YqaE (UPF0057 family)
MNEENDPAFKFIMRVAMAFIVPPLAVLDRGCGTSALVFLLWMAGIFPGIFAALFILLNDWPRQTRHPETEKAKRSEQEKRKGAYVQLSDGAVAEVVDDDDAPVEKFKRG